MMGRALRANNTVAQKGQKDQSGYEKACGIKGFVTCRANPIITRLNRPNTACLDTNPEIQTFRVCYRSRIEEELVCNIAKEVVLEKPSKNENNHPHGNLLEIYQTPSPTRLRCDDADSF